jgi:hypothetical protein
LIADHFVARQHQTREFHELQVMQVM